MYVLFVAMFMTLSPVILTRGSLPEHHLKNCRRIGAVRSAVPQRMFFLSRISSLLLYLKKC